MFHKNSPIHTIPFSLTSVKLICWNATMYETKNLLRLSRIWQSGHCWVLFLKTNVWSHKQVRLSWQHFPHQSVLTRLHTVLVSKEKPRKRHLWTLLTRHRQVSSPAPATMIFHQHCLHRYQLHCHQTYQSLRCSHHLPKLNDLFLTLEKSLDGWSSNPQHSWPASKYPVCPFTLFAGLRLTRIFKKTLFTQT